jgi:hypothetical protein
MDEEGVIEVPTDPLPVRMRLEALAHIAALAGAERGPDLHKWDDFAARLNDTATWLETGAWPEPKAPKLKRIDGGRDAPKAAGGQ